METLNVDLDEINKNSTSTVIRKRVRAPTGVLGAEDTVSTIVIPPINTGIVFKALPSISAMQYPGLRAIDTSKIPENFNWRENGDPSIRAQITKPPNQHMCGSCWAVSSASVISDNFVVTKKINNPSISPTWILACNTLRQQQCNGGNPANLMATLSKGIGLVSDHCIDYSWCSESSDCNPPPGQKGQEGAALNQLIPGSGNCGCYNKGTWMQYFINNSKVIPSEPVNGQGGQITPADMIVVKHHIMNSGTLVSGFVVFGNFRTGKFANFESQEGVYLEDGNYDGSSLTFGYLQNKQILGGHAISVIGWGITKNPIDIGGGKKARVPYWYCRNSWGEKWADGGYFKFAMYPYNKNSTIGNKVWLNSPQGRMPSGGLILVNADSYSKSDKVPYLNKVYSQGKLDKPSSFYNSSSDVVSNIKVEINNGPGNNAGGGKKLTAGQIAGIVIGSLVGLFIIIMIIRAVYYYVLYKNFKKALRR